MKTLNMGERPWVWNEETAPVLPPAVHCISMLLCCLGKNFVLNHKGACNTEGIRSTFFPCTGAVGFHVHPASALPPEPPHRPSETPKKKPVHEKREVGSLVFSLQRNKLLGQVSVQEVWICESLLVKVELPSVLHRQPHQATHRHQGTGDCAH